jgi:DMSO/TMAO reductase YedYZ molybdopterin-dependent catalytic subunit
MLLALIGGVLGAVALFRIQKSSAPFTSEASIVRVDGFVQYPLNLTMDELRKMPRKTVKAPVICIDFPNRNLDEGTWTGVRLDLILEKAGVISNAEKIAFYSENNFTTDLTLIEAKYEDVIIAYEKDTKPLTGSTQEYPQLRLVVPGKWGYKWIKDVKHIEIVNGDFKGIMDNAD